MYRATVYSAVQLVQKPITVVESPVQKLHTDTCTCGWHVHVHVHACAYVGSIDGVMLRFLGFNYALINTVYPGVF